MTLVGYRFFLIRNQIFRPACTFLKFWVVFSLEVSYIVLNFFDNILYYNNVNVYINNEYLTSNSMNSIYFATNHSTVIE